MIIAFQLNNTHNEQQRHLVKTMVKGRLCHTHCACATHIGDYTHACHCPPPPLILPFPLKKTSLFKTQPGIRELGQFEQQDNQIFGGGHPQDNHFCHLNINHYLSALKPKFIRPVFNWGYSVQSIYSCSMCYIYVCVQLQLSSCGRTK